MLDNLLNSKLKRRLLQIFFRLPVRSFSAEELRTMTGTGRGRQLKDALKDFSEEGVVSQASRKHQRCYRLNRYFRLREELKDLITETGKDDAVEDLAVRRLRKLPDLELGVLSGIFTLEPRLPLDILLVGRKLNYLRAQKAVADIEKLVGQEVNYAIMGLEEYRYRRTMNDRLIRDIFDYPHILAVNLIKKIKTT